MGALKVFLIFLAVRLFSVFYVATYFVPDEYWQSLEVAHKLAFGYGHLTWEWVTSIRSYVYPIVFAAYYEFLKLIGQDSLQLVVFGPRVLQALLTAYSDYRFYVWSGRKKWSVFLMVTSYFWFYAGSRTLINTLEASLTTIALSMFPWQSGSIELNASNVSFKDVSVGDSSRSEQKSFSYEPERTCFLWFATLCCYIRPTAILTWLPLFLIHLKNSEHSPLTLIFKRYIPICLLVSGLCAGIDSYLYGKFTASPFNFFMENVYKNIGSYYGAHEWYWYVAIGLPTLLGVLALPFLIAVIHTILHWKAFPVRRALLVSIFCTLLGLSLVEHKEHRFLLIILPMCLFVCSDYLSRWSARANSLLVWLFAAVILAGNIAPAWYFSRVHQKGSLEIMKPLAEIADTYRDKDGNAARFLFFMPCHSTPYYSHIHRNITMYFVECDPHSTRDYEIYNSDPERWLRMKIPAMPLSRVPSHVVLFNTMAPKIRTFLSRYRKIDTIHHTDYPVSNTGSDIFTYEIKLGEQFEKDSGSQEPIMSYSGHDEL